MEASDITRTPDPSPTQALLKRLRARGLSQSEISRRTQISQPKLSRWENGDVADGADDALKLQALEKELAGAAVAEEQKAA
jgi:transcriptional regulator with XRE-family HTH domain